MKNDYWSKSKSFSPNPKFESKTIVSRPQLLSASGFYGGADWRRDAEEEATNDCDDTTANSSFPFRADRVSELSLPPK